MSSDNITVLLAIICELSVKYFKPCINEWLNDVLCSTCTDTMSICDLLVFSYIQCCWVHAMMKSMKKSCGNFWMEIKLCQYLRAIRLYRTFASDINKWKIAHFHHIFRPVSTPIVKYHLITQVNSSYKVILLLNNYFFNNFSTISCFSSTSSLFNHRVIMKCW